MDKVQLVGGTESDRQKVLEKHAIYIAANGKMDWETLRDQLWSDASEGTFFNLNGHTYKGREPWIELWKYYTKNLQTGDWTPFDMGGVINEDLAVVWCHRNTHIKWVGGENRADGKMHDDKEFHSRSTMVFRKEKDDWRVIHVHFSEFNEGPRPGGI